MAKISENYHKPNTRSKTKKNEEVHDEHDPQPKFSEEESDTDSRKSNELEENEDKSVNKKLKERQTENEINASKQEKSNQDIVKQNSIQNSKFYKIKYSGICLSCVIVILLIFFYYSNNFVRSVIVETLSKYDFFCLLEQWQSSRLDAKTLQAKFSKIIQTDEFISVPTIGKKILNITFKRALEDLQIPVVLLLIASKEQNEMARNISRKIVSLFSTGDPDQLSSNFSSIITPDHSKQDIEHIFEDALYTKKYRPFLVLEDLEQLEPTNAMIFHQYMNDENSRFRPAFIIITLKYNNKINVNFDAGISETNRMSTDLLQAMWKGSWKNDDLDCLINRIAPNSVVLASNIQ